jgi:hypothetical protein
MCWPDGGFCFIHGFYHSLREDPLYIQIMKAYSSLLLMFVTCAIAVWSMIFISNLLGPRKTNKVKEMAVHTF